MWIPRLCFIVIIYHVICTRVFGCQIVILCFCQFNNLLAFYQITISITTRWFSVNQVMFFIKIVHYISVTLSKSIKCCFADSHNFTIFNRLHCCVNILNKSRRDRLKACKSIVHCFCRRVLIICRSCINSSNFIVDVFFCQECVIHTT